MQLACHELTFPAVPRAVAFGLVRQLGFDAVDLCLLSRELASTSIGGILADPTGAGEIAAAQARRAGLFVSDVLVWDEAVPVDGADGEEHRRRFTAAIAYAAAAGSPGLTTVPGRPAASGTEPGRSLALTVDALGWCVEAATARDLAVSIEPCLGSCAQTPEQALRVLDAVPGLRLTVDHAHIVGQGLAQADCDQLLVFARHVHLRQARPGQMQASMADGTIDLAAVLAAVVDAGYTGTLCAEFVADPAMPQAQRVDCLSETVELKAALDLLTKGGEGR